MCPWYFPFGILRKLFWTQNLRKTAVNQSLQILKKLLLLHGRIILSNHVILIDDKSGIESYLGPDLLIPKSPQFVILNSDPNSTTLSLKEYNKTETSSDDGEDSSEEAVDLFVSNNNYEEPHHTILAEDLEMDGSLFTSNGKLPDDIQNCCNQ